MKAMIAALRSIDWPKLAVALCGLCLVSYGAWRAWAPAGYITLGLGMIFATVDRPKSERRDA